MWSQLVKVATYLAKETSRMILSVGLLFVFGFVLLGYAYLRGALVTEGVTLDVTRLVTTPEIIGFWMGLLALWGSSQAFLLAIKARAWLEQRKGAKGGILQRGRQLWCHVTGTS